MLMLASGFTENSGCAGKSARDLSWSARMTSPPTNRAPMAGGVLLALGIIVGVIGGSLLGQPSIGFLVGVAVGLVAVGAVWLIDRRR